MPKRKEPTSLVEKFRQEVTKQYTRVPGEDYEEWCEFIRFEIDERLQDAEAQRMLSIKYNQK